MHCGFNFVHAICETVILRRRLTRSAAQHDQEFFSSQINSIGDEDSKNIKVNTFGGKKEKVGGMCLVGCRE